MVDKEMLDSIKKIVTESANKSDEKSKVLDYLFKALIAVLVYLGMELRSDVDIVKTELSKINTERTYNERDILEFKNFLKEPRFTKKDFIDGMKPLFDKVNRNTMELEHRGSIMHDRDTRIVKLEYALEQIEKKIVEMYK